MESALTNPKATPLLHGLAAAHGYILMLVHVCRTGQPDIRNLAIMLWGSREGLLALKSLCELYTSLVWESTLLLAMCGDEFLPSENDPRDEWINIPVFDKVYHFLQQFHTSFLYSIITISLQMRLVPKIVVT